MNDSPPTATAGPSLLLTPVPGRLGGELGARGDLKLREHVREMGLRRPA